MHDKKDIDLKTLSKKAQINFVKFYIKNCNKISFTFLFINLLFIFIILFTINWLSEQFPFIKLSYAYYVVIAFIVTLFVIYFKKYAKKELGRSIETFYYKHSQDKKFNFCFECNDNVTTKHDHEKCPICNNSLIFELVDENNKHKYLQDSLSNYNNRGVFYRTASWWLINLTMFGVLFLIFIKPAIEEKNEALFNLNQNSAIAEATINYKKSDFYYLKATKHKYSVEGKIIGSSSNISVKAKIYKRNNDNFIANNFFLISADDKRVVKKYCKIYNEELNLLLKKNNKN